ncbi:MAG TPA: DUF892 family protein [Solirubrobacteraceae bacterium]|nr:DUF892 family protein [Solirubrobacteraceae bacterium]
MPPSTLAEQLTKYLTDAHCIEQQALIQMKAAPRLAGDRSVAAVFSEHETETQDHERLIAERLSARGASRRRSATWATGSQNALTGPRTRRCGGCQRRGCLSR